MRPTVIAVLPPQPGTFRLSSASALMTCTGLQLGPAELRDPDIEEDAAAARVHGSCASNSSLTPVMPLRTARLQQPTPLRFGRRSHRRRCERSLAKVSPVRDARKPE